VPPKPSAAEPKSASNILLRSLTSLILYLVLGYYFFHRFEMLLLITGIVVFHELGHFVAMKFFRYKDLGIFFIPLLGAYVSGKKREVSQRESAIILLAGPLPGIVVGTIIFLVDQYHPDQSIFNIELNTAAILFMFLNIINLAPIYPLDGGQLLNRVFFNEESWLSRIFVILSALFLVWVALFATNPPLYILLLFPVMMITRMFGDKRLNAVEKKIEAEGINLDTSYEDLPDIDYWKIRNILAAEHPGFKDVAPAPPYEYDQHEDKIMVTVQSLLQRSLIQDVSLAGKALILVIWLVAFASPWLLKMDMRFFHQFGF
jgi:stage IV sporulation protein FB